MDKKRGFGVIIFGIIDLILGSLGLLLVIIGFKIRFFPRADAVKGYAFDTQMGAFYLVIGIVFSLFLLLGIYTLKSKPAARIINLILSPVIGTTVALPFLLIIGGASAYIFIPLGIIGVIFYFTRPKVKEQFRR